MESPKVREAESHCLTQFWLSWKSPCSPGWPRLPASTFQVLGLQAHATMPIPAPPILRLKPQAPGVHIRYERKQAVWGTGGAAQLTPTIRL